MSSQRNEADAQASYRALQGKFPAVLGSHAPVIKRADLGDKGVYYRAMVGPFGTSDEASAIKAFGRNPCGLEREGHDAPPNQDTTSSPNKPSPLSP